MRVSTVALPVLFVACLIPGCGGGGASSPSVAVLATVQFSYQAATAIDPQVRANFPGCVARVGGTHIHPGWQGFQRVNMTAVGADRWEITFSNVPVGRENRIRVSDPNTCDTDPNGASTENVSANGVRLTRVVDTPGTGTEPGLAFTVTVDGTVTP